MHGFFKDPIVCSFAVLGDTARIDYKMISMFNYRLLYAAE